MASYPNQIKIIVEKSPANKMRGYSITDRVDEEVASKVLNAGAFKLWRYWARNADGYNFWLSPKAVEEEMKRDQYRKARDELIAVGYLVPIKEDGNIYIFKERLNNNFLE